MGFLDNLSRLSLSYHNSLLVSSDDLQPSHTLSSVLRSPLHLHSSEGRAQPLRRQTHPLKTTRTSTYSLALSPLPHLTAPNLMPALRCAQLLKLMGQTSEQRLLFQSARSAARPHYFICSDQTAIRTPCSSTDIPRPTHQQTCRPGLHTAEGT